MIKVCILLMFFLKKLYLPTGWDIIAHRVRLKLMDVLGDCFLSCTRTMMYFHASHFQFRDSSFGSGLDNRAVPDCWCAYLECKLWESQIALKETEIWHIWLKKKGCLSSEVVVSVPSAWLLGILFSFVIMLFPIIVFTCSEVTWLQAASSSVYSLK